MSTWCCASVKYIIRRNEVVELAGTAHSRESFLFHGSNSGAPHLAFFRITVFVVHGPAGSMIPIQHLTILPQQGLHERENGLMAR